MGFTALVLIFLAGSKYADYLDMRLKGGNAVDQQASAVEARVDARLQQLEATLSAGVDPLARDQEVMKLRRELAAVEDERKIMNEKVDEISRAGEDFKTWRPASRCPRARFVQGRADGSASGRHSKCERI